MKQEEFKRELNTFSLLLLAVGAIIGAGVFSLTGIGIKYAGPAASVAYLAAALITIIGAIPMMIAASSCPTTGGYYKYISRFLHPVCGFYYMWNRIVGVFAVSTISISFGQYVQVLYPKVPVWASGLVVIWLFTLLNIRGIKLIGRLNKYMVYILAAALVIFIISGLPKMDFERLDNFFQTGFNSFIIGVVLYIYALDGAALIVNMGSEVKNPQKSIPIAIIGGTIVASVFYGLIALISTTAVDWKIFAGQPLGSIAKEIMNPSLFWFFIVGGAFLAILSTLNAGIMVQSRIFWAAAKDGIFPRALAKLNSHSSPYLATIIIAVIISLPLVFQFKLDFVTLLTMAPSLIFNILMFLSVLKIPKRYPGLYKGNFLPLPYWLLVVFVLAASGLSLWLSWTGLKRLGSTALISLLVFYAVGTVYFFVLNALRKKSGKSYIESAGEPDPYWIEEEEKLKSGV